MHSELSPGWRGEGVVFSSIATEKRIGSLSLILRLDAVLNYLDIVTKFNHKCQLVSAGLILVLVWTEKGLDQMGSCSLHREESCRVSSPNPEKSILVELFLK